jgi:putative membrane protein
MTDLLLAILHHLIVFGLAAVLAAELALMRSSTMSPQTVKLLGRFDFFYGMLAMAILVVGFVRVWFGAKGPDFYLHNHAFWAKIAAFAVVGLISIKPTMRILAWQKSLKANAAFVPPLPEIAKLRRWLLIELHVFALIPVFAAMMARGVGYGAG